MKPIFRHSGESRNPKWTPAFAGVTFALAMTICLCFLASCSSTYKRSTVDTDIKTLAKKDYNLDVEVQDTGNTVGVRLKVKNFLGEMMASDQMVWTQIDNLMVVMSRVMLSMDRPPQFFVMDIVDADNNDFHILFTRAVVDLRKIMAEGQSRTQYQDRLVTEIQIGTKRSPLKMDPVWIMMMASEITAEDQVVQRPFLLEDVKAPIFYAKAAAATLRRILETRQAKNSAFLLRDVEGLFFPLNAGLGVIQMQLDVISSPKNPAPINTVLSDLLSLSASEVKAILKSYQFDGFSQISIVERNSGKVLTLAK